MKSLSFEEFRLLKPGDKVLFSSLFSFTGTGELYPEVNKIYTVKSINYKLNFINLQEISRDNSINCDNSGYLYYRFSKIKYKNMGEMYGGNI